MKALDLSSTSVIAFATHGLLSGELSGLAEPALVLTPPDAASPDDDGLLTASEIAELRLSTDWVILSACNTAGTDGRPDAEGLSGLARAFLYAGARSILVSHWPVRDDAAARLTTGTLSRIGEDATIGRSQALRQAMLSLMEDENDQSRPSIGVGAVHGRRRRRTLVKLRILLTAGIVAFGNPAAAHHVDPFELVERAFSAYQAKESYADVRAVLSAGLRAAPHDGRLDPGFGIVYAIYADAARFEAMRRSRCSSPTRDLRSSTPRLSPTPRSATR